jgi:AcrR family transcriptional regulator
VASREDKKAATRKKLLDAAATLIAKNGALSTSLDAIAEKAGLTKGAVYSNFSGKEALIEALAEMAGPTVHFDGLFDETRSLADNLEALGEAAAREVSSVSKRAWQLGLELLHYALRDSRMRRQYATSDLANHHSTTAVFADLLERSGERTTLRPEEIEVVLSALALGLTQRRAINPSIVPDELFPKAFRLLAS